MSQSTLLVAVMWVTGVRNGSKKWKPKGRMLYASVILLVQAVPTYVCSGNKRPSLFSELCWGSYLLERNSSSQVIASTLRILFRGGRENSSGHCIGKTRIKAWSALHSKSNLVMASFRSVWKSLVENCSFQKRNKAWHCTYCLCHVVMAGWEKNWCDAVFADCSECKQFPCWVSSILL